MLNLDYGDVHLCIKTRRYQVHISGGKPVITPETFCTFPQNTGKYIGEGLTMYHRYLLSYPLFTYHSAVHSLFTHLQIDTMPTELRKLSDKLLRLEMEREITEKNPYYLCCT